MYRSQSGSLGSSSGDEFGGRRRPARSLGRPVPKAPNACRTHSAVDVATRPVTPAEEAQARLFEGILQVELVELLNLLRSMTLRGTGKRTDEHWSPETRTELSARIEEVHRLIHALQDRFPHGGLLGEPSRRGLDSPEISTARVLVI